MSITSLTPVLHFEHISQAMLISRVRPSINKELILRNYILDTMAWFHTHGI